MSDQFERGVPFDPPVDGLTDEQKKSVEIGVRMVITDLERLFDAPIFMSHDPVWTFGIAAVMTWIGALLGSVQTDLTMRGQEEKVKGAISGIQFLGNHPKMVRFIASLHNEYNDKKRVKQA